MRMGVNGTLHMGDCNGESGGWEGYENMADMSEAVTLCRDKGMLCEEVWQTLCVYHCNEDRVK